jgi:hypothetical protein
VSGCFGSTCPPQPLTIDAQRPFWSIVRTRTTMVVGDLVSKIGIATGWTQGLVRQVCMTTKTGVAHLCQAYSDFQADVGDSGSPVLLDILGGTDTTVTLGGILSGKIIGGPNDGLAVFSTWDRILQMYPGLRVN